MGQRVRGLYPHVSGRGQEISVRVRAVGGLSSRSEGAVLNGANVALFKAGVGGKVFLEAAVVDDQTYKLSGLLPGRRRALVACFSRARNGDSKPRIGNWGLRLQWRAGRESFAGALYGMRITAKKQP